MTRKPHRAICQNQNYHRGRDTDVSLEQFLTDKIDNLEKNIEDRFIALDKAITLAANALEAKFKSDMIAAYVKQQEFNEYKSNIVNELKGAMTKKEYGDAHKLLQDETDRLITQLQDKVDKQQFDDYKKQVLKLAGDLEVSGAVLKGREGSLPRTILIAIATGVSILLFSYLINHFIVTVPK